jgi:uncharacterized membrane protein
VGFQIFFGNPVASATMWNKGRRRDFLGPQLWMGVCAAVGAGLFLMTAAKGGEATERCRE